MEEKETVKISHGLTSGILASPSIAMNNNLVILIQIKWSTEKFTKLNGKVFLGRPCPKKKKKNSKDQNKKTGTRVIQELMSSTNFRVW